MSYKLLKIGKIASYIFEWYTKPSRLRHLPDYPRVLNLLVTEKCNCRCQMCNVWERDQGRDLCPKDLRKILQNPLFGKVSHVGVSGGEPTLRDDLCDLFVSILESLPQVTTLSLTTNGTQPDKLNNFLPIIKDACAQKKVSFSLNVSLDGLDAVHDKIRGRERSFVSTLETLKLARQFEIPCQLQCTISSGNVYQVEGVMFFALKNSIDVIYRLATTITRLDNQDKINKIKLESKHKSFLADFLTSPTTLNQTRLASRRLFYLDLAKRLVAGGTRKAPCYFQFEGVMLSASGLLYNCSICTIPLGNALESDARELYFSQKGEETRRNLLHNSCPSCMHDQAGAWSPYSLIKGNFGTHRLVAYGKKLKTAANFFTIGNYLLFTNKTSAQVKTPLQQAFFEKRLKKALIVGCYGGEHVGDAAILGGVLQRIERDFSVKSVVIASSRPDRTERWSSSLKTNLQVTVIPYNSSDIEASLPHCDSLVFAGGPLMDLPALLVKHLQAALKAKSLGLPVLIEGCGIGPFRFELSRKIVRRLLAMADHVRLRTQASVDISARWGTAALLARDPAFDYLDSRALAVTNSQDVPESLATILVTNKKIVGINLRPLWQKYAKGYINSKKVLEIEEAFLSELTKALIARQDGIRYVFFPMNPDQYGFSDLSIAFRLKEKLPEFFDFMIWEYEPDVDELIYFLSKMTSCLTMRFHASIFSLALKIPTIGIDYGISCQSKVGDLFCEAGLADSVISVDNLKSSWVVDRLDGILGSVKRPRVQ